MARSLSIMPLCVCVYTIFLYFIYLYKILCDDKQIENKNIKKFVQ